jgi:hypothetical protein
MKRNTSVCYVDDDPDDVRRFRALMQGRYTIGAGHTLPDALGELKQRGIKRPDIFLLDLYYGPNTNDDKHAEIAESYEGLSKKAKELQVLLIQAGQSPNGGFDLVEQVRQKHKSVSLALFSRKASMEDAERAHRQKIPVLKKPDPDDSDKGTRAQRYDMAFQRHRDELARQIDGIIGRNTWWARHARWIEWIIAFLLGLASNAAWSSVGKFIRWI